MNPSTSAIAGLHLRHFQTPNDYEAMAAIHAGSQAWDHVDPLSARESVPTAADLAQTFPESEIQANPDLMLAEIDEQVVGYSHVLWRWTEVTGQRIYLHLGYVLPEYRRRGIGQTLLNWVQQRIQTIAQTEQPAGETIFATNISSTEREAAALINKAGYHIVRQLSDMQLMPLHFFPSPEQTNTISIRPISPEDYRDVYRTWKDAFAELWTSTAESEADYQEFLDDNINLSSFDPTLCQVAWIDSEIVGFAFARIRREVGMITEVSVRKAWQRRGIGRRLMTNVLNLLHERSIPQVRLFTNSDDEQGARSLYEQLGFREIKRHYFYRKPFHV